MLRRNQTYEKFTENVRESYEKRTIAYKLTYKRHAKELRKNYDVS